MFLNFKLKIDDFAKQHYQKLCAFLLLLRVFKQQHPSLFLEVLCFLLSHLLGIIG